MSIAQPLQQRSRLGRAWDAVLGRETAAHVAAPTVAFAEVVWAHHQRQEKEVAADAASGPWHDEYRKRLEEFCATHGAIVDAYWCRYEASGVALTEKALPRKLANFYRRDSILKLHTATDWRTANTLGVTAALHRWQTAAIKASEVLRDASERIALHRIFAGTTRLLAYVDRAPGDASVTHAQLEAAVRRQERELADVNEYYERAGENAARIVYFRGMMWGTAMLAALVGGCFLLSWWWGWLHPNDPETYTLFVCLAMGAAGAVLSVMTRMARDGFSLEYEVGRKSIRYLGGLRPWIGALSAFVVYIALKSGLLVLFEGVETNIYFYATIAFASGFSERRAKVLLGSLVGDDGSGKADGDDRGPPDGGGGLPPRGPERRLTAREALPELADAEEGVR